MSEKQKAGRRTLKSLGSLSQTDGTLLCPQLVRRDGRLYLGHLQRLAPPLRSYTFVPESLIITLLPGVLRAPAPEEVGEALLFNLAGCLTGASPEPAHHGLGNTTRLIKGSSLQSHCKMGALRVNVNTQAQGPGAYLKGPHAHLSGCLEKEPLPGACHCPWS